MRTISTPGMGLADCGFRTVPNTRAPRSASNCAISRPMPEETPVTNVVLSFSEVCIYICEFQFIVSRHSGGTEFAQDATPMPEQWWSRTAHITCRAVRPQRDSASSVCMVGSFPVTNVVLVLLFIVCIYTSQFLVSPL